ncbi:hypothetical protein IMG5_107400 [Ichthyophthirius multifiliis]|uniref:Uncharacterized protein n=1 Tax=Ichthyophthirius multifiliis TaxID=5932 RepID=G0QTE4_ICHMU|nr:hypothetical protein IMG5_107400 [Ichthyophthirius multifiliis]EGR31521.1 hypothetical protein IMG5_107400 [Ichthyophthirius multifiliis]|eukprot:XP_004035007.1 hypothetical protein IMG5_107400 [Ichthyophthirius multifiliis]
MKQNSSIADKFKQSSYSPDKTQFSSHLYQDCKLQPVYPKIVDNLMSLMCNNKLEQNNCPYKFQDKGLPILINYRALQNKQKNLQIPINLLIEYFNQWIDIMKIQIDVIIQNLYDCAKQYYPQQIKYLKQIIAYDQKYMKYMMLSIGPSREIHQNNELKKIEMIIQRYIKFIKKYIQLQKIIKGKI